MKSMVILAMALILSLQAFGQSDVRKVYRLSTELSTLQTQLEFSKQKRRSQITKIVVSTTAAVALGLVSKNLMQARGGDITGPTSAILGAGGALVTLGIVGYDGYQVYQLTVSNKVIPELQKAIQAKQAELDLILQADDQAEAAMKELNN